MGRAPAERKLLQKPVEKVSNSVVTAWQAAMLKANTVWEESSHYGHEAHVKYARMPSLLQDDPLPLASLAGVTSWLRVRFGAGGPAQDKYWWGGPV